MSAIDDEDDIQEDQGEEDDDIEEPWVSHTPSRDHTQLITGGAGGGICGFFVTTPLRNLLK